MKWCTVRIKYVTRGTLTSNEADGNENVKKKKKPIGFFIKITETSTLQVHHAFFVHFFPIFARLRRQNA